jgi:acetoin utilization protein AcuB
MPKWKESAWMLMQKKRIKHLPVLQDETLIGVISSDEVLKALLQKSQQNRLSDHQEVASIVSQVAVTTSADTEIRHVAKALTEFQIGSILIVNDNDDLVGIITLKDLVAMLANYPSLELMT